MPIPNPGQLRKVYQISDVEDVELIARFAEYEDTMIYGIPPHVLDYIPFKIC